VGNKPVQVLADESRDLVSIVATRTPDAEHQIPITGAGGRVPAAAMSAGSPPPSAITIHGSSLELLLQAAGDDSALPYCGLALQQHSTLGGGPYALLAASRGGTVAAPLVSQSGDQVGVIVGLGHDGTDFEILAEIAFLVGGTPGDNDMPGKIEFRVTPDGGFATAVAMTIAENKLVTLAGALTVTGATTVAATQRIVSCLTEVVTAASLVDGLAAVGTKVLTMSIPVGARIVGIDVTVEAGFAGDVSATFKLGDGSDDDRYHTGAPSIFATAADGIAVGIPSGAVNVLVANTPTITVTSAADITPVIAGGGSLTVRIYYVPRS
jgi:hypothetical protein